MKKLDNFANCLNVPESADFAGSFIPAFAVLEKTLRDKLEEAESAWE